MCVCVYIHEHVYIFVCVFLFVRFPAYLMVYIVSGLAPRPCCRWIGYLDAKGPGLKHQRNKEKEALGLDIARTRRGLVKHSIGRKFRRGACENCGAMTHKTKVCVFL